MPMVLSFHQEEFLFVLAGFRYMMLIIHLSLEIFCEDRMDTEDEESGMVK